MALEVSESDTQMDMIHYMMRLAVSFILEGASLPKDTGAQLEWSGVRPRCTRTLLFHQHVSLGSRVYVEPVGIPIAPVTDSFRTCRAMLCNTCV